MRMISATFVVHEQNFCTPFDTHLPCGPQACSESAAQTVGFAVCARVVRVGKHGRSGRAMRPVGPGVAHTLRAKVESLIAQSFARIRHADAATYGPADG